MSKRADILHNLETTLKTISVVNGYNTDVKTVLRSSFSQDEFDRSACPALAIVDDGMEKPESKVGTNWRVPMTITLQGLVRHGSNSARADELSDLYSALLADIRKAIHAADLGTYCIYARPGETRAFTGENLIVFTTDVEILYYYPETNP